ncbi:hypothetical protein FRX31_032519 [Thalictrum thalictroides]|uniref:Uncharacterized protein n=1 Tax=Thalictrum thalictroides TaxID=46969 RepID=A0A7J6UYZ9_THATH|nr:hypothetical protein FRX31_032519 [Thalictrum thalictroides]
MSFFSDEDLKAVMTNHENALVFTLNIGNFLVSKILVDSGSLAEILYYKTFQEMGLQQVDIKPSEVVVFGLNNESVLVIG